MTQPQLSSEPSLRSTNFQSVCASLSLHCSTLMRAGMRACLPSFSNLSQLFFSLIFLTVTFSPRIKDYWVIGHRIQAPSLSSSHEFLNSLTADSSFQAPFFNLFSGLISTPWMMQLIMETRGGSNLLLLVRFLNSSLSHLGWVTTVRHIQSTLYKC